MALKERVWVALIALAAGYLGGIISARSAATTLQSGELAIQTVRAKNFVLFDGHSRRRGIWSVTNRDVANLNLYDTAGAARTQLSVLHDGTAIFGFFDNGDKPALVMSAVRQGGVSALAFFNPDGSTRAQLSMQSGQPAFVLCDHRGKRLMRLAVDQDQPAIALYDGQGKWRTLLTLNSDGTPELGFADQNTKPRAMIGLQPDGRVTFALSGDDGRALAVLTQTSEGSASFKLFGADGRVVGKMP